MIESLDRMLSGQPSAQAENARQAFRKLDTRLHLCIM